MNLYEDFKEWAIKELRTKTNSVNIDINSALITLIKQSKDFEKLENAIVKFNIKAELLAETHISLWHKFLWE